jgi:asparagine synthase (glutamine-hydrolysing)
VAREATPRIPRTLSLFADALRHRGPDGEGFWLDVGSPPTKRGRDDLPPAARIGVVHRRLSIVDLVSGDQPMSNEDGTIWVAFNGEIYNHLELRHRLEAVGHRFATASDTEVLVHGWEEWGEGLLADLNGIFAFTLVDHRQDVILLARDPVGVKPLYVGINQGLTWWSSELGAARAVGCAPGEVSAAALKLYLMFRFIPSPASILEDTWKIPPSHFVLLHPRDAGQAPTFRPYSTRIRSSCTPSTDAEWSAAIIPELSRAVQRQLMSDVPVGALLSGGIDSSVVSSMMVEHLPGPPQAFGIGFRSDGDANEALAAAFAAQQVGLPYTPTLVEDAEYLSAWPTALREVGEPIGNSSGLLLGLLCRTVARTHKVVLTGQGADEPLGGYPRHMAERLYRLGRLAPGLSGVVAEAVIGRGAGRRLRRVMRTRTREDRYLEIFAVLEPDLADELVGRGPDARSVGRAAIARWMSDHGEADSMNDLLRVDARTSLVDDLLLIADHFSMRASVELRVPFLDLEFLDLIERMPSRYKVSWIGERKWLYRRAACRYLPQTLTSSLCGPAARFGKKFGFHTPLERWFIASNGPLQSPQSWLGGVIDRQLLRREPLARFVRAAQASRGRMVREMLALYSLSQWSGGAAVAG